MPRKWDSRPTFGDRFANVTERYDDVLDVTVCEILYGARDAEGNPCAPVNSGVDGHGHLICAVIDGAYQAIAWREPHTGKQLYGRDAVENAVANADEDMRRRMAIVAEAEQMADGGRSSKNFGELMKEWKEIPHLHIPKEDRLFEEFMQAKNRSFQQVIDKKNDLINRAVSIANSGDWKNGKEKLDALRGEWKTAGRASSKAEDDRLWEEFNSAVNSFYERKHQYYENSHGEAERKKEALIERARNITSGDVNYNAASKELKALVDEWKQAGFAGKGKDEELWNRYRAICDDFYDRKRRYSEEQSARIENNKREKYNIISEAEQLANGSDFSGQAVDAMRKLDERWKACGFAGTENDSLWNRFKTAKDIFYENRSRDRMERRQAYRDRLEERINNKKEYIDRLYSRNEELKDRYYNTRNTEKQEQISSWIRENESKINEASLELSELEDKERNL